MGGLVSLLGFGAPKRRPPPALPPEPLLDTSEQDERDAKRQREDEQAKRRRKGRGAAPRTVPTLLGDSAVITPKTLLGD